MSKMRRILSGGENGFTLIELLVVIAVLGILAAIAIPRLGGVTDKARLTEATSAIGSIKTSIEMFYTEEDTATLSTGDLTSASAVFDYVDYNSLDTATWQFGLSSAGESDYKIHAWDETNELEATYDKALGETDTNTGVATKPW